MSSFRVEQKVVCIDDGQCWLLNPGEIGPEPGVIYTIRGIDPPQYHLQFTSLYLVEIVNPVLDYGPPFGMAEVSFGEKYFRPVVERKTDTAMAFLKKLTTGTSGKDERIGRAGASWFPESFVMTAPISNIYRCGCHGALECPSLERPDRAGAVIGLTLSAASGFIAGSVVTLLLVKLIA